MYIAKCIANKIAAMFLVCLCVFGVAVAEAAEIVDKETSLPIMTDDVWKDRDIKDSIENVLGAYFTGEIPIKSKKGKGPQIKDIPCVVMNIDKAAGIEEARDAVAFYQASKLAFAISPSDMGAVLQNGMDGSMLHKTYGADDGKGREVLISAAIDEAVAAYAKLYERGWISVDGKSFKEEYKNNAEYRDFVANMMWLYHAVHAVQPEEVALPWSGFWFTGMTPYEAYSLSVKAVELNGDYVPDAASDGKKSVKMKYTGETVLSSIPKEGNGAVRVKIKHGISSSKQIAQLAKAVQTSGLDLWVLSSANYDIARAVINYYNVPSPDGIVALRNRVGSDGAYENDLNVKYNSSVYGGLKADAVKKDIMGYYKAKSPVMLVLDKGDDVISKAYPNAKLAVLFDGEAVEIIKGIEKSDK